MRRLGPPHLDRSRCRRVHLGSAMRKRLARLHCFMRLERRDTEIFCRHHERAGLRRARRPRQRNFGSRNNTRYGNRLSTCIERRLHYRGRQVERRFDAGRRSIRWHLGEPARGLGSMQHLAIPQLRRNPDADRSILRRHSGAAHRAEMVCQCNGRARDRSADQQGVGTIQNRARKRDRAQRRHWCVLHNHRGGCRVTYGPAQALRGRDAVARV